MKRRLNQYIFVIVVLVLVSGCATTTTIKHVRRWKEKKNIDRLLEALKEENWIIQTEAAIALGELKEQRGLQPLILLLDELCIDIMRMDIGMVTNGEPPIWKGASYYVPASTFSELCRTRLLWKWLETPSYVEPVRPLMRKGGFLLIGHDDFGYFISAVICTISELEYDMAEQALVRALECQLAHIVDKKEDDYYDLAHGGEVSEESVQESGGVARITKREFVRYMSWSGEARIKLAIVLGSMKSKEAIPFLIQCLADPEWLECRQDLSDDVITKITYFYPVRKQALWALREITGEELNEEQAKWREWWEQNKEHLLKDR